MTVWNKREAAKSNPWFVGGRGVSWARKYPVKMTGLPFKLSLREGVVLKLSAFETVISHLAAAALFVLLAAAAGAGLVAADFGLFSFDGEADFGAAFVVAIGGCAFGHSCAGAGRGAGA